MGGWVRARAIIDYLKARQGNFLPQPENEIHFPTRLSHSLIFTLAHLSWLLALPRQSRNETAASKLHLSDIPRGAPTRGPWLQSEFVCCKINKSTCSGSTAGKARQPTDPRLPGTCLVCDDSWHKGVLLLTLDSNKITNKVFVCTRRRDLRLVVNITNFKVYG